jgi:hypothetical protein
VTREPHGIEARDTCVVLHDLGRAARHEGVQLDAAMYKRMGDLLKLMMVLPLVMLAGMWILRWIVRGGMINLLLNPMLPEKSGGPNYGQRDPAPAVEWHR